MLRHDDYRKGGRMRFRIGVTLVASVIACMSCAGDPVQEIEKSDSRRVEISFSYNTESYPRMLGVNYPQMAVWVTAAGEEPRTLFVTEGAGKNRWIFADERPSSLPVWFGIRRDEGGIDIDAVSGATPKGETHIITWEVPERYWGRRISVFIEANVSFDYNDYYSKEKNAPGYSDVNGQPSVVWEAAFDAGDVPRELTPEIIGHGHVMGMSHGIDPDLRHITTAAELFHYIRIAYIPGK
jgi:hypothetical protein